MGATGDLVGRDALSRELEQFLAAAGGGAMVLVGDAGVGKSSLLEQVTADIPRGALRIVGVEAEQRLSWAGLHQLLFPLRQRLSAMPEETAAVLRQMLSPGAGPGPHLAALGAATLELLAVTDEMPRTLVIDDAHWIDVESAQVLGFVARRLSATDVKLLVAIRSGESSAFDTAGLPRVPVDPISAADAEKLIDRRFPDLAPAAKQEVLNQAAGNPLALVELPSAAMERSDDVPAGPALAQPLRLPERLQAVYLRRIEQLDDLAREELLRGALDGATAGRAGSSGPHRRYRMQRVEGALEQGLVVIDARDEFAFRHPLVRAAVVQLATPNQRRAAHDFLATVHEDDVERHALHLAAATLDPDESVAQRLENAARHAIQRGAADSALSWLTRAAELSERAADRNRRLADAAYIAGQAARLDEAERFLDTVREGQSPITPATVITDAYVALYREGDVIGTHRRVLSALQAPNLQAAETERLVNLLLAISQFRAEPDQWERTDEVIDEVEPSLGSATLLYRDAWGDVVRRGASVRERLPGEFDRLAAGEPWDVMRLAVAAFYVDALVDHRPELRRMVERESETGAVTNVMTMLQIVTLDQLIAGDWDAADATARRGQAMTEEHGYPLFGYQFQVFRALIAAQRGDTATARKLRDPVDMWARPRRIGFLTGFVDVIDMMTALGDGDWDGAYAKAESITTPGSFPPYRQQAPRTVLDLVEAAVRSGRLAEARLHATEAARQGLPTISPRFALTTAGALAISAGDDTAGALYADALNMPEVDQFPYEAARIRLAYGEWLRRRRENVKARQQLEGAAAAFDRLHAARWAERARLELRAAGAPTRTDAINALTPQERQIAELAATGLTNKQIGAQLYLSPRTVGAHLYRIFPKLGITSRASLRDALARNGEADQQAQAQS